MNMKSLEHMAKVTETHSLVQIIERVGDPDKDLHAGLSGQLPNSCITILPKGFGVILI